MLVHWSVIWRQHPLASKIESEVILYLNVFNKKLPHYLALRDSQRHF